MADVRFYTKPTCTTCRKAKAWLDEKGANYETFDLNKKQLPDRAWLEKEMKSRGVEKVINPRSTPYREKDYKNNPPSMEEALDGIEADPNLLRRPVLVRGKEAVFGFEEGEFGRLVG